MIPTKIPLVKAAKQMAALKFNAERGGIRKSIICPKTLAIVMDEEELAKEFCTITIAIKPGAINSPNEISGPKDIFLPIASIKIAKKSKAFTTGERRVWL